VIGVVVIGMLTRYLGQGGFGQYTTIMAFLQFFGVVVDLGLYVILVKKISEANADEEKLVSNIFTLRLVSAIIFLGLAPVGVWFFPYPDIVRWGVLITSFSFLGITLNQALAGVFQKHLRMDKVVIAEVVGRLMLIGITYYVIRAELGLLWIMGSVVAGSLVNFIVTYILSRSLVRFRLRFNWPVWKDVIKDSWPIALSIAFNLVYFKADTIILSLYYNADTVGIYGAAYKVLEVFNTLPAMFAGLVLPLLAAAWASLDRERFKRVLQKAFDAMILIAVPLAIGTLFLARPVMDLVAPDFIDSARVLQILIFAASIIFIGNLFGNTVVAINKQKTMMWLYLLVAVVSLIGYLILIPRYSYFGAAGMTVASELLITISAALVVYWGTRILPSLTVLLKSLLASAVMAGVLYFISDFSIFVSILISVVVYLLVMYIIKGIRKETLTEIIRLK